ncbi:uncharacterized protein MYCGRDRAFT_89719 [Zymoseptoria tritici IPO323]|uniref:Uncharacterized protein n=1 Tax=Zymoseptoria tritici (strain CBS 115943 / IPO323) TaxID=336722 RepID=F9X1A3_ZYMTI|nr:uncharacterized protein MYCGRDRAFT_89719 [Zymoseptoria tritici IPO323]EGP91458.1 hypothetical protein MYCGRDRAFT_89719 [Zymoseptoria tritici IPO323]
MSCVHQDVTPGIRAVPRREQRRLHNKVIPSVVIHSHNAITKSCSRSSLAMGIGGSRSCRGEALMDRDLPTPDGFCPRYHAASLAQRGLTASMPVLLVCRGVLDVTDHAARCFGQTCRRTLTPYSCPVASFTPLPAPTLPEGHALHRPARAVLPGRPPRSFRSGGGSGPPIMSIDEGGLIVAVRTGNGGVEEAKVQIMTSKPNRELIVPLGNLKIGALRREGLLTLKIRAFTVDTSAATDNFPGVNSFANDARRHFASVLSAIGQTKELPPFSQTAKRFISSADSVRETCNKIRTGIRSCSPKLFDLLNTNGFTLDQVMASCKTITLGSKNGTAGIYARIYSDFKPNTRFSGHKPYVYIGQAKHMQDRFQTHRDATSSKHLFQSTPHYKVARAARSVDVIQLCELPKMIENSEVIGKGQMYVVEQLFVLLFEAYHPDLIAMNGTYTNQIDDDNKKFDEALEIIDDAKVCQTFRSIGREAMNITGFATPGRPGREKPFGSGGGCNWKSPLDPQSPDYEPTTMIVEELSDRFILHLPSKILAKQGDVYSKVFYLPDGASIQHVIRPGTGFPKANDFFRPEPGDRVVPRWEVMKDSSDPAKQEHGVPHFRTPGFSPYNNSSYANKIAFFVTWYSEKSKKWYSRYYQVDKTAGNFLPGGTKSCERSYCIGTALYAYLIGSRWDGAPDWFPVSHSRPILIQLEVNQFEQTATANVRTTPLNANLPKVEHSLARAKLQMENAGLSDVGGQWRPWVYSQQDWRFDPQNWLNGELPRMSGNNWMNPFRNLSRRTMCDYCVMSLCRECERIDGTDRCKPCVYRGLPCSWTPYPGLNGRRTLTKMIHNDIDWLTKNSDRFVEVYSLFSQKPGNAVACTAWETTDPGLMDLDITPDD